MNRSGHIEYNTLYATNEQEVIYEDYLNLRYKQNVRGFARFEASFVCLWSKVGEK